MRLIEFNGLRNKGIPHGRVQIWRKVKAGDFPAPVKIGHRNAWVESEVDQWIVARIRERDSARCA
jgi:prophage regulatory protein